MDRDTDDGDPVPSRQEMFDRAYLGLKSQGWRTSAVKTTESSGERTYRCVYETADGRRCAWGWVDRSLGVDTPSVGVWNLRRGLVNRLVFVGDMSFASALQDVHDKFAVVDEEESGGPLGGDTLRLLMEAFAADYELTVPDGP